MDKEEFRKRGIEMIDYIIDYLESLPLRPVTPITKFGYLKSVFPPAAPEKGESFEKIMKDIEKYIMPGLIHWQHPGFHAQIPSSSSYPATLAEIFVDSLTHAGFRWSFSPCGSELETIVLDWYGELMGLPNSFLYYRKGSNGGGILHRSSSESLFISMITARKNMIKQLSHKNPSLNKAALLTSLVAYTSEQCYYVMNKAAKLSFVNIKFLQCDETFRLRGETLENAVKEDMKIGLVPFFVCIILGSECGACDPIDEIGPICERYGLWLNVEAAYAGTALICPEYKHFIKGIEYASSFIVNPSKWLLLPVDSTVLFVKNRHKITESVIVEKTIFGYNFLEKDWGYPSRFTEFVVFLQWFVMRLYGVEGLQKHIRNHIRLAKLFESYVKRDERFEVISSQFGIVCFRLKDSAEKNKNLLRAINSTRSQFMISCILNDLYVIRFVVCAERANESDIASSWNTIREMAEIVLKNKERELKLFNTEELCSVCFVGCGCIF